MSDIHSPRGRHPKSVAWAFVVTALAMTLAMGVTAVPANAATVSSLTVKVSTKDGVGAPGLYVAVGDTVKKTAADGTATFKRVKSGQRRVVVSTTKGVITTEWQYSTKVKIPAKKKATVTVRPSSLTVVTGKVTRGKKAVTKKTVTVMLPSTSFQGKTDKQGRYAISVTKPLRARYQSPARVVVDFGNGRLVYANNNLRHSTATKYKLSWTRSNTANIKVTTDPAQGAVSGTVRDASGTRVDGAEISVETVQPDGVVIRTANTGSNGRFKIGGLPKGTYRVYASDPDANYDVDPRTNVVTVKVGSKKVSVGTLRFPTVGTVKVPISAPSSSSDLWVTAVLQDESGASIGSDYASYNESSSQWTATLSGVPVGRYRVVLGGLNTASGYFDVTTGQTTTAPLLTVPSTVKATGRVTLPDNTGIWAEVYAVDANGTDAGSTYGSSNGSFTFGGLAPGKYSLLVFSSSDVTVATRKVKLAQTAPVIVTVAAGVPLTGVKISLGLGGTVSGKVIDKQTKKRVAGIKVVATRVTPTGIDVLDSIETDTTSKGAYKISSLAPGVSYKIAFVDTDGVYRTTWYKAARSATKATALSVGSAKAKSLGTASLSR